jgi:hypothetical protein
MLLEPAPNTGINVAAVASGPPIFSLQSTVFKCAETEIDGVKWSKISDTTNSNRFQMSNWNIGDRVFGFRQCHNET